jgi:hypothetical protein
MVAGSLRAQPGAAIGAHLPDGFRGGFRFTIGRLAGARRIPAHAAMRDPLTDRLCDRVELNLTRRLRRVW